MITPKEIWNITQWTFIFGIFLSIIALIMLSREFIFKQSQKIKEEIRQYEKEHGLNKDTKEQ